MDILFASPDNEFDGPSRSHGQTVSEGCDSRGLDPTMVTPHVMRHTAITKLVQAGIDLPTIQRISGHKTFAMVLRYTRVHGSHIDKAIAAIGRDLPDRERTKLPAQLHRNYTGSKQGDAARKPSEGSIRDVSAC